jgi:lathosterol oxidase
MQIPDVSIVNNFLLVSLGIFIVIMLRYFIIAGLFYVLFHRTFIHYFKNRKINDRHYSIGQFRKEIAWSILTGFIFSIAGTFTLLGWQKNKTLIYTDPAAYAWWYLPLSLVIAMAIHETYYYWLHRLMHIPSIYKQMHKVHHDSKISSPWTSFSFHPYEAIMQAIILPFTLMIIPMHPVVILVQLTIMTFSSVINHLDIELYPSWFNKNIIGKWLVGATHHSLHHKQFRYNYGLYFTFWDKWKKTESPFFEELFRQKTANKA